MKLEDPKQRFASLKESNLPPLETDIRAVEAAIQERSSLITSHDTHINSLQRRMDELLAETRIVQESRLQVQSDISYLKIILSPIRRTPPEILAIIFRLCITLPVVPRKSTVPLIICHVCSGWRKIAMGTPQLWETLEVLVAPKITPAQYAEMFEFWFGNSGALPPSLTIKPNYTKAPLGSEKIMSLLPTLLPHLRKLTVVSKDLPLNQTSPFDFLSLGGGHIPLLEELCIDVQSSVNWDGNTSGLKNAPSLHKIYYRIPTAGIYCPTFPWKQLTWLDLRSTLLVPTFHAVIHEALNLKHGRFLVHFSDERYEILPLQNQNLMTFCLTTSGNSELGMQTNRLLEALKLKALQKFQLKMGVPIQLSTVTDDSLCRVLSGASLQTLVLSDITFQIDYLITILSKLRYLERLGLYGNFDLQPICTWLSANTDLPKLTHLFICTQVQDTRHFDVFADMVILRHEGGPLNRVWLLVKVRNVYEVRDDYEEVLEEMVSNLWIRSDGLIEAEARYVSEKTKLSPETGKWFR